MSLSSQVLALASRIASEFNAVRSELSAMPAGNVEYGTSFPASPTKGQLFLVDTEQVVYVYGGSSWIALNKASLIDGGTA